MIILDLSLATYDVKKAIYSLAINDTDTALAVVEVSLLVLSLNFPLQARSVFTQKAGVRYISQSKMLFVRTKGARMQAWRVFVDFTRSEVRKGKMKMRMMMMMMMLKMKMTWLVNTVNSYSTININILTLLYCNTLTPFYSSQYEVTHRIFYFSTCQFVERGFLNTCEHFWVRVESWKVLLHFLLAISFRNLGVVYKRGDPHFNFIIQVILDLEKIEQKVRKLS